jgi:hypothetical protein
MKSKLEFEVKEGQYLVMFECDSVELSFKAEADQTMTMEGEISYYEGDTTPLVYDYVVSSECIKSALEAGFCIEDFHNKDLSKSSYRTYTDVGGKEICICEKIELEGKSYFKKVEICGMLKNGFGDGGYTMRFQGNSIVRNFSNKKGIRKKK